MKDHKAHNRALSPGLSSPHALVGGAALLLLLLTGTWGCDDFTEPSQLDKLRIMAIQADPPEAAPGETVTLKALTYSPPGSAKPKMEWRACLLQDALLFTQLLAEAGGAQGPGSGEGDTSHDQPPPQSCFQMANTIDLTGGEMDVEGDLDLMDTALGLGTGEEALLTIPMLPGFMALPSLCTHLPMEERFAQGGREQWIRGVWLTVSLKVDDGTNTEISSKRVVVRPPHDQILDHLQGMPYRTPLLCEGNQSIIELDGENQEEAGGQSLCQRNRNPEEPGLALPLWPEGGEPLKVAAGETIHLIPALPEPDALQPFVAMSSCIMQENNAQLEATGGEYARQEGRVWAWYGDQGKFSANQTYFNPLDHQTGEGHGPHDGNDGETTENQGVTGARVKWTAPKQVPHPARVLLHMVVRDGRGGVSWSSFPVEMTP